MHQFGTIAFILLVFSCDSAEPTLAEIPKLLHGKWEYVGIYKDGQFKPDTISRASHRNEDPAKSYKLYNLLTDSGAYQHVYWGDSVVFYKKKYPWVKEFNTETEIYSSFFHSYNPNSEPINERLLFHTTFHLEVDEKTHLVYGSIKTTIRKLTKKELVIFSDGTEWHYKKLIL